MDYEMKYFIGIILDRMLPLGLLHHFRPTIAFLQVLCCGSVQFWKTLAAMFNWILL